MLRAGGLVYLLLLLLAWKGAAYLPVETALLRDWARKLILWHVYLISFGTPALAAAGMASEWDRRHIESLLVTQLSVGRILAGRVAVAVLPMALLVPLGFVCSVAISGLQPWPLFSPWVFASILCAYLTAFGSLGGLCGVWLRSASRAVAAAEMIVLALWSAVVWLGPLMHFSGNPAPIIDVAQHMNPAVALLWVLGDDPIRGTFLYRYDISPIGMYRFDYPTWASVFFSYLAASLLLHGLACRSLKGRGGT
ncbi:MAG: hypothetical protein IT210_22080 [Armatimonadetes bacterium]|nr:hypothetical protein [Armatimonadota bacterium]